MKLAAQFSAFSHAAADPKGTRLPQNQFAELVGLGRRAQNCEQEAGPVYGELNDKLAQLAEIEADLAGTESSVNANRPAQPRAIAA